MKLFLLGSIAFDEIGQFKGHFKEVIKPEMMEKLTVSFLVEDSRFHFGGCSGNTAYGLGLFNVQAYLCSRIGEDSAAYETAFKEWGMQLDYLERVSGLTARATVTTDLSGAQIAHFATGVIGETAPDFMLPKSAETGDLILVEPENPRRMRQAVEQSYARGLIVYFDPGQLIHTFQKEELMEILEQVNALLVNEYEWQLLLDLTGLKEMEVFERVPLVWITKAADGLDLIENGKSRHFPIFPAEVLDPTGAGDALRAGICAGIVLGKSLAEATEAGLILAAASCEYPLAQGYKLKAHQAAALKKLGFA